MNTQQEAPAATVQLPAFAYAYDSAARSWRANVLADMDSSEWANWIKTRLRGKDKWFGYGREEYPDFAARIFESIAEFAAENGIDLTEARKGAAQVLAETTPSKEKPVFVLNVILVARHLSSLDSNEGAETVAGWLRNGILLEVGNGALQRRALFSLAALQKARAEHYARIWKRYFRKDNNLENPYFYIPAAFEGLVKSSSDVPVKDVVTLLKYHKAARREGHHLPARSALRALWAAGFSREKIRRAAVMQMRQEAARALKWKHLRALAPSKSKLQEWSYESSAATAPETPRVSLWRQQPMAAAGSTR